MRGYLWKRSVFAAVTIFVAMTVNFVLFRVLPGNAVTRISRVPNASPALKEALEAEFGLDKPIFQQYLLYLQQLLHGNLGISFTNRRPVLDNLIDAFGVLPGEFMSSVFSMMTPMRSLTKYNVDLIDVVDDEAKWMNFLRMEKWLADRPHHPGEAAKQWLKDLYQENQLVKGDFILSGRKVSLGAISAPTLNVFALDDHIIPPTCSKALGPLIGTRDYTEIPLPGGHVGLFVSSKSQGRLSKSIAEWLAARD